MLPAFPLYVRDKTWSPSTLSVVVVRQVDPYRATLILAGLAFALQPTMLISSALLYGSTAGCSNPPFTSRFVSAKPTAGGVYGSGRLRIVPVMPFTMKARPAQSPG